MDAAGEIFALHGQVLRLLCGKLGSPFDGVRSAARAAFRAGILSSLRKRKITELDVAYHIVRHITAASSKKFVDDLVMELGSGIKVPEHAQVPVLRATASEFIPAERDAACAAAACDEADGGARAYEQDGKGGEFQHPQRIALCTRDFRGRVIKIGNISRSLKFGKLKQAYVSRGPGRGLQTSRVRFVFNRGANC
eukprot:TRINITY_DN19839_c0_g1_i1.p1 TRINITY_DN19839_c0_g1~~TRINITY_DN19839_c0_g1_i1.p1  ORF type:complete len:212 (-),score=39.94 TRINITY_DN19839_c0_g1_i1:242-826(-)